MTRTENIVTFRRPDAKALNIEIIRHTPGQTNRHKPQGRHRHNFHAILFIQAGGGRQEIDLDIFSLAPQQVVIIPKGAIHQELESLNIVGYEILFTDEFFSDAQRQLLVGFLQHAIALRKLQVQVPTQEMSTLNHYFELLFQ
ncbi:MAG: hypothetical protein AAGA62_04985, partial [Bacteroidota bacterium]